MKLVYKPHQIYSKPSKVFIVKTKNKRKCLEEAVEKSGFKNHLNKKWEESGRPKGEFRIAIKPNIMTAAYEKDISVYTDVEFVEDLIKMIRDEGYRDIKVVESRMVWSLFYEDRTVENVAKMVGYSSTGYEVVDLTDTSKNEKDYDYGDNELGIHPAGPEWRDADYRISFAKNKTHFQCYYTGCMKNVYGCLPEEDKLKSYHGRKRNREFHSCTIAVLDAFDVHFAFLDAYFSGDGLAGLIRDSNPNETNTIICGENCYAVDWVQGLKMGVGPPKNYVIRRAMERWGMIQIQGKEKPNPDDLPTIDTEYEGDISPYPNWKNILPYTDTVVNLIEEFYSVSRFACYILAYRMHKDYKPVKNWTYRCSWLFRKLFENLDYHRGLILFFILLVFVIALLFGFITADI